MNFVLVLEQTLNGLQLGVMLFLMAAGLTLVFGIMNLVNLAHGSLYMVGAYFAAIFAARTGSFVLALLLALPATALVGIVVEVVVLRTLYRRDHLDQVLATFGLILFFNEGVRLIGGKAARYMALPHGLEGNVALLPGLRYPAYRLVVMAVGLAVAVFLYLLVTRTRMGMLIRAGASNRTMVGALGINITRLYTLVFGLGAALAGVAGVMAGPIVAIESGMGEPILILTFVVIVIGGIGSIRGAFAAALLVGLVDTMGRAFLPPLLVSVLGPQAANQAGPALASMLIYALIARALDAPFYVTLFGRIMIWAIAALSLNLILGYGGMVSFGHAAYLGVGVYTVGILSAHGIENGYVQWPLAIAASALVALGVGAVSLRTSGVYFIMITLAFGQMLYFLGVSLKAYGGDDGMTLAARSQFGHWLDLENSVVFYYLVLAVLLAFHALAARVVNARFGLVVQGVRVNERRMRAIGVPTFRYKLAAFVIAGAMCGVAGVLLVNFTKYVSPAFMHWTRSGEIMVMVILGGMGTRLGPALGAAVFLLLEEVLSGYTEHWQLFLGPVLIVIVLFARRGLAGIFRSEEHT